MARSISSRIFLSLLLGIVVSGVFVQEALADCPQPSAAQQAANGFPNPQTTIPPGTPPGQFPAGSYMQCITARETGGWQSVTNAWGYSGMFAFGVNAAATAGYC
jgi:hypothetical protein